MDKDCVSWESVSELTVDDEDCASVESVLQLFVESDWISEEGLCINQ